MTGAPTSPGGDGGARSSCVPRHIAFIMDGNGRWAEARGLPRARGHEQGAEMLRSITRHCAELGVEEITCYALSTENLRRRPPDEVDGLMELLRLYLNREDSELDELGVRMRFIGNRTELPIAVQEDLARVERDSARHGGMILRLAINYGSRAEIVDAARALAEEVARGALEPAAIDEAAFVARLSDASMPDPDLLIRTAGEQRISNFLLWQISYAELYFAPCPWPDFTPERLDDALRAYGERRRKYGGIAPVEGGSSGSPRERMR